MLLLHGTRQPPTEGEPAPPLVALFGVGLLGSALGDALLRRRYRQQLLPLAWEDDALQRRQLAAIGERIEAALGEATPGAFATVWAAGRAGFGSTAAESGGELASFRRVLALAGSLAERHPRVAVSFHMLSSVGGLFEGQRLIGRATTPAARRPYGDLKLRQEEQLLANGAPLARHVYRLTSVFGAAPPGGRRGLVATLLHNGVRHRVTRIVGRLSTLRDFTWAADVARYVVWELLDRPAPPRRAVHTLASGKPSSIHELLRLVEATIGRRLYVRFDPALDNSLDVTVSPSLLPAHWRSTDLGTAVRRLHLATP